VICEICSLHEKDEEFINNSVDKAQGKMLSERSSCRRTNNIKMNCVRFQVFTSVTIKNEVFWDVVLSRFRVNRRFGGTSVHTGSTRCHIPEDGILLKTNWLREWQRISSPAERL
jgi:hypothetical protein